MRMPETSHSLCWYAVLLFGRRGFDRDAAVNDPANRAGLARWPVNFRAALPVGWDGRRRFHATGAGWRTACGDVRRSTHIEAGPLPLKMDARNRVLRARHTEEPAHAVNRRDQQERNMGIGMQIAYFGFAGAAQLEAEASIQLMRLEPFCMQLAGCHLAIEAMGASTREPMYDVRLDLITRKGEFCPVPHTTGVDPMGALERAFDLAERQLAGAMAAETHANPR